MHTLSALEETTGVHQTECSSEESITWNVYSGRVQTVSCCNENKSAGKISDLEIYHVPAKWRYGVYQPRPPQPA